MIKVNDIVTLVKPIGELNNVGDLFEISNINEDGVIEIECGYGFGIMTISEFNTYFTIVKPHYNWTSWIRFMADDGTVLEYKTNNKRIIVKGMGVKSKCSCCPDDIFDLEYGLKLCVDRLNNKLGFVKNK